MRQGRVGETGREPRKREWGGYVTYTLTSELEQTGGTKVTLSGNDESGYQLLWEKGETIRVYANNSWPPLKLKGNGGTSSGTFESETKVENPKYAVYGGDSSKDPSVLGDYLTFSVPKEITVAVGNTLGSNFPAVANIEVQNNTAKASFHNVFGLLRVGFSGNETLIKKIVLHDLAGNALWGTCKVPIVNEKLDYEKDATVENNASGANTLTLNFTDATNLDGESVYFPVPAGALDDGFSIVLYDATGAAYSFLQKITGTAAVPRSKVRFISASIAPKPEDADENARGYYKSLFVNAGMNLDNHYLSTATADENDKYGIPAIGEMAKDEGFNDDHGKFYEYFASNEIADFTENDLIEQRNVIVGNETDRNGVLLYPDGAPRFRLVYCNGGSSESHGKSLTKTGRERFKTFFDNGGSYSGSCAGSFLASTWVDGENKYNDSNESENFTFGIFPGNLEHTNLPIKISDYPPIYTNMEVITNNIPEKYKSILKSESVVEPSYQYNSDNYPKKDPQYSCIPDIRHHGGSYLPTSSCHGGSSDKWDVNDAISSDLELLMRYRFSLTTINLDPQEQDINYYRSDNFHRPSAAHTSASQTSNKNDRFWGSSPVSYPGNNHLYSTWAYKPKNSNKGRVVCTGSHPEYVDRDYDKQYTRFMFQYAMDGSDNTRVKSPELQMGVLRSMNQTPSTYDSPETTNAPIGDRQYHHFKFTTSAVTKNFVLRLDSGYDKNSGIDLYLGLRQGDKAWLSEADYTLCNKGGQKELHIKSLPAGEWYVSVFCATTVTQTLKTDFPKFTRYSGKTEVLNGIPYSIKIFKEGTTTGGETPGDDNPWNTWTSTIDN